MSNDALIQELSDLKDHALRASATNDRAFYDGYLRDDATAILPVGRLTKAQVLASMVGDKAPFSAERVEHTVIRLIGTDAALVTYDAIYLRDGKETVVAATTLYARENGRWQGVLYQQTPLPAPT